MEALFFFLVIIAGISVIGYYMRKASSSNRANLSRVEREIQNARRQRAEKLATPSNNRLSNSDEVWRARRKHVGLASESAEKTVGARYLKYKTDNEPSYDGYSRADRRQLTPGRIKREGRLDDIALPSDERRSREKPLRPQTS